MKNRECPLTPAEINLAQTCADNHTHSTADLMRLLNVEASTVNTHFAHMRDVYGDLDRFGLLWAIAEDGWIGFPAIHREKIIKNDDAFAPGRLLQSSHTGKKEPAPIREEGKRMPMKVRYTVYNGQIIAEKRNGVRKFYVPDAIGNTVALVDNTQTITDTFSYWPYGEASGGTGPRDTRFRYGGTLGVRTDSTNRAYARARFPNVNLGRWQTPDPSGIRRRDPNLYRFALSNPVTYTDPSGLDIKDIIKGTVGVIVAPFVPPGIPEILCRADQCALCAAAIIRDWYLTDQHRCNHGYTHCMACCVLAHIGGPNCANASQGGWSSPDFVDWELS